MSSWQGWCQWDNDGSTGGVTKGAAVGVSCVHHCEQLNSTDPILHDVPALVFRGAEEKNPVVANGKEEALEQELERS